MKIMLFLSLCLLALTMANPNQGTHNPQHTFLVKTDLTKEQIVNLLNEYHRNHTNHEQEMETGVHHENETIELKVKKEKKQKTHNQQVQENKPESPKEVHGSPHHKTENKQVETPETPKKPEIPEQPEAPEQQEAPEAPEAPESPENQEVTEEEKTNLKKKKKNKEQKREQNREQKREQTVVEEVNETPEKVEAEIETGRENKTEINNNCTEGKVNLMAHNGNDTVKQGKNSFIFNFFSIAFISFIFICLFVYATQPKKRAVFNQSFTEFTDYLLVKDNHRRKYDLKEF